MNAAASDGVPLRIDFVSDVVCPWCAIGLASLEQALARIGNEVRADIHFRPFELNPQLGSEGEDIASHLQRKYGLSSEQLVANHEAIRQRGAELGFVFDMEKRRRIYNTFDAHRLLHWAGLEGKQAALKRALLHAYFTEGRNIANTETLLAVAGEAGLSVDRAREVLVSDAHANDVRAEEEFYLRNGIQGVPAIIIDQRHLISGGQPVEVFENALRRIMEAKRA